MDGQTGRRTDGGTDGRTEAIALPPMLKRSVNIVSTATNILIYSRISEDVVIHRVSITSIGAENRNHTTSHNNYYTVHGHHRSNAALVQSVVDFHNK